MNKHCFYSICTHNLELNIRPGVNTPPELIHASCISTAVYCYHAAGIGPVILSLQRTARTIKKGQRLKSLK